ncbi:MAG: hypothetical protein MJE63_06470 [Proteobacteria bacterium]|nr:hypothetical protein [Pseudomonadota bacterium]
MSPQPATMTFWKRNQNVLIYLIFLPGFFLLLTSIQVLAQEDDIQIEYASSSFNQSTQTFSFKEPRVRLQNLTVSGTSAQYQEQTKTMSITGDVIIYTSEMILTANKAVLDLDKSVYTLFNATFFDQKNAVYGKAERIEAISSDTFKLHKGEITTCNPRERAWELSSSQIVYQVDNFAYSVNSVLYLYSVPVFYTPFISWPTKDKRSTGFLAPRFSHHSGSDETKAFGSRLEIPYFIALDRDHDLTITADLVERRGTGLELDYQYAFIQGMKGQLKGWYLNESVQDRDLEIEDLGSLDATSDDFDLRPERYSYLFNHKQGIPFGGTLNLELLKRSDNEVDKEYFNSTENLSTQFKQSADISYSIPYGSFSVAYSTINTFTQTSVYDTTTDEESVANKHPEVSISQQYSRLFGSPVSVSLNGSWTQYDRVYGWNAEATTAKVKVSSPFNLDFLNVKPSATRTFYRYKPRYDYRSSEDTSADIENNVNEFGWKVDSKELEVNFEIFRYFLNARNQKTAKLSFIPRIIYSEIEDVPQETPSGFGIVSTTMSKKSLTYQLDTVYKVKNLATSKVRNFFQLSLVQPFDLNSENCADSSSDPDEYCVDHHPTDAEVEIGEQQLPLRISATLNPTDRLSGNLFYRYNHQEGKIQETRITLSSTYLDGGEFSLSYIDNETLYKDLDNISHPGAQTFEITNAFPISDRLKFTVAGKWDQARSKSEIKFAESSTTKRLDRILTEFSTVLAYKHPCYTFTTSYSEKIKEKEVDSTTEEYLDKKFTITFSLPLVPNAGSSGFGELKLQDDYDVQ